MDGNALDWLSRKRVRFAVGTPGERHGSAWIIWANKSDFYLGAYGLRGKLKISLHESRICRLALTDEYVHKMRAAGIPPPEDRALFKWIRPPAPDLGAHPAVILTFPTDHMYRQPPVWNLNKPLVMFEAAPPGHSVEVGFFYSREAPETLEPKLYQIGRPILRTNLDNGDSVSLVVRQTPFDPQTIPPIGSPTPVRSRLLDPSVPIGVEQEVAATLICPSDDGYTLKLVDVSKATYMRDA